jgi:cytidyltransferase-like protein
MKIAIISGGFDPVHVGHIELMEKAKSIADSLVVIVNDDDFLTKKKGKPFMPLKERIIIVRSIKYVDMAIKSVDKDQTVCESLKGLASCKTSNEKLLFCNGGDRTSGENTPEHKLCLELGIELVYGLGDKIQSSSWLINK